MVVALPRVLICYSIIIEAPPILFIPGEPGEVSQAFSKDDYYS